MIVQILFISIHRSCRRAQRLVAIHRAGRPHTGGQFERRVPGAELLTVRGLSVPNRVWNVDLTVREGEVEG
jgi:hypothetical protein